jgi:hypothetical protein
MLASLACLGAPTAGFGAVAAVFAGFALNFEAVARPIKAGIGACLSRSSVRPRSFVLVNDGIVALWGVARSDAKTTAIRVAAEAGPGLVPSTITW